MRIKDKSSVYFDAHTFEPLRDITIAFPTTPIMDAKASEEIKNEIALQIGLELLAAFGVK